MKGLLVCALVVTGAFAVKGAHELCGLEDAQITVVVRCIGEKVDSQLTDRAREVIRSQGGDVGEFLRRQCDADVDFTAAVGAVLSAEEAEAVRVAYRECRAVQS